MEPPNLRARQANAEPFSANGRRTKLKVSKTSTLGNGHGPPSSTTVCYLVLVVRWELQTASNRKSATACLLPHRTRYTAEQGSDPLHASVVTKATAPLKESEASNETFRFHGHWPIASWCDRFYSCHASFRASVGCTAAAPCICCSLTSLAHTPWVFEVFTSTVTVEQTMLISRKWRYGIDNHSTIVAELREITTSGGTPGDGRRMARKREKDAVRGYQARCAEKSMCSGQFLSRHVQLGVPLPCQACKSGA